LLPTNFARSFVRQREIRLATVPATLQIEEREQRSDVRVAIVGPGPVVLSDVLCEVGVTDSALGAGKGHRDQAEDQVQGGWIVSPGSAREFC
jgi:hypothetical protein